MIFVRDKGRMCNNMLQYGHVYAWAREHNRKAISMRFCYKYPYFAISRSPGHNFLVYLTAKYGAKLGLLPVVSFDSPDDCNAANERRMLECRNVVVQGWHVRFYDLFAKYKPEILRLFAFKPAIEAKASALIAGEASGCAVTLGLHVRRGDYKTWKGGKYYFDDDAYASLARRFADMHPGKRVCVFVCGNDPRLDADRYRSRLGGTKVAFAHGNPAEDLCLLSKCDYIMGPPSTFSLVASMYGDRPLCWAGSPAAPVGEGSFRHFDQLFRQIE